MFYCCHFIFEDKKKKKKKKKKKRKKEKGKKKKEKEQKKKRKTNAWSVRTKTDSGAPKRAIEPVTVTVAGRERTKFKLEETVLVKSTPLKVPRASTKVTQIAPSYSEKSPVSPVFKSKPQFWIKSTIEMDDVKVSSHETPSKSFVNDGPGYSQTGSLGVTVAPKKMDVTVFISVPGTETMTSTLLFVMFWTFNSPIDWVDNGADVGNEQLPPIFVYILYLYFYFNNFQKKKMI